MDSETWLDKILAHIDTHVVERGYACVLAHPACMEIADSMRAFDRLCAAVSRYETVTIGDAAERLLNNQDKHRDQEMTAQSLC
jgi:hypothetical protein